MKQKAFMAALAAALLLGALALPVSAQDRPINYETYVVDSFDNTGDVDWTWIAAGSRFVTEGYPLVKYFDGMPSAMRLIQSDPEGEYKVLGVQFAFDRQGDNWVDVIPMASSGEGEDSEDAPYEIPFRGIVSRIDMWVWGAGYNYQLEILVRDYQGRVHALSMGSLNYEGWRNLAVNVPTSVPQTSRYLSEDTSLKFVGFRIRTSPRERVDSFTVFFDQFRVLTDTYQASYDGYEFVGADFSDGTSSSYSAGGEEDEYYDDGAYDDYEDEAYYDEEEYYEEDYVEEDSGL